MLTGKRTLIKPNNGQTAIERSVNAVMQTLGCIAWRGQIFNGCVEFIPTFSKFSGEMVGTWQKTTGYGIQVF